MRRRIDPNNPEHQQGRKKEIESQKEKHEAMRSQGREAEPSKQEDSQEQENAERERKAFELALQQAKDSISQLAERSKQSPVDPTIVSSMLAANKGNLENAFTGDFSGQSMSELDFDQYTVVGTIEDRSEDLYEIVDTNNETWSVQIYTDTREELGCGAQICVWKKPESGQHESISLDDLKGVNSGNGEEDFDTAVVRLRPNNNDENAPTPVEKRKISFWEKMKGLAKRKK